MTKIVCIADLQGQCKKVKPEMLPKGDILLIAGDLTTWGNLDELKTVNNWLGTLKYKHKIVIAGNHDGGLENHKGQDLLKNATYLQDAAIKVEGLKIYGSPVNDMHNIMNFRAFCEPSYIKYACNSIPEKLDILITHGPPFGKLDYLPWENDPVGSRDILDAVMRAKPKYHMFGHIHEGYGILKEEDTTFVNAATCDGYNNIVDKKGKLLHEPIVLDIP